MDSLNKTIELQKQIYELDYKHYIHVTLFSLKWWILLLLLILIIIIFCKLIDKKRLMEIALVGFVTGVLVFIVNSLGAEMGLWVYPMELFEIDTALSEIELIITSFSFMLLYQYVSEWKKYIVALIVLSAVGAFIGVPVAVLIGIYKLLKWKYIYSFIVFIGIGVIMKFIVSKIINIQKNAMK